MAMDDGLRPVLRNGRWYVHGTFKGVRVREAAGTTDRDRALARKAEIELEIINGTYRPARLREVEKAHVEAQQLTFDECALKYLRSVNTGKSDTTDRAVMKLAKYFKNKPLLEIGTAQAEQYVEDMHINRGNKASTARRELVQLQAVVNYGRELLKEVPLKIRKPSEDEVDFRVIKPEEWARMREIMTAQERWVFEFMLMTGARPMQAGGLQRTKLTLREGRYTYASLHVRKGRGKPLSYHKVPLNVRAGDAVVQALAFQERIGAKSPSVFLTEKGESWDNRAFRYRLQRVCKALKIADEITPYDFRHTFASWLGAAKVYPITLKELMGHSSLEQTLRYCHVDESDGVRAVNLL